jgi:hypothetical protein
VSSAKQFSCIQKVHPLTCDRRRNRVRPNFDDSCHTRSFACFLHVKCQKIVFYFCEIDSIANHRLFRSTETRSPFARLVSSLTPRPVRLVPSTLSNMLDDQSTVIEATRSLPMAGISESCTADPLVSSTRPDSTTPTVDLQVTSGSEFTSTSVSSVAFDSIDQNELNQLAEAFRLPLARLRRLAESLSQFESDEESQSARSQLHEQLAQALRVLRTLFEHHPSFQCAPLLLAAGDLIQAVKTAAGHSQATYDGQLLHAIDKLAVLFGSRYDLLLCFACKDKLAFLNLSVHLHTDKVSNATVFALSNLSLSLSFTLFATKFIDFLHHQSHRHNRISSDRQTKSK